MLSIRVFLALVTLGVANACSNTCTCYIGQSLTTGVGNNPIVQNFGTTNDANAGCTCCDIEIVDQLNYATDAFRITPVASSGPFTLTGTSFEVCQNKAFRVVSERVAVIKDFAITECATTKNACVGFTIPSLFFIRSGTSGIFSAVHTEVYNITLTGTPGGSCTAGLGVSCFRSVTIRDSAFHVIDATAIAALDLGPGQCFSDPERINVTRNVLHSVGGGNPSLLDAPGIAVFGAHPLRPSVPEATVVDNRLVALHPNASIDLTPTELENIATFIHMGCVRSGTTGVSIRGNRMTPDITRVGIRLDSSLGWTWDPGFPLFLGSDDQARLRQIANENRYTVARVHDVANMPVTDDLTVISPDLQCSDICPPSPFQTQNTNATAEHDVLKVFILSVVPYNIYSFEVLAFSNRPTVPIVHFDRATASNELIQLDTCASRTYNNTTSPVTPQLACNDTAFNSNGWNITDLGVQGNYASSWRLQRNFIPGDLAACAPYNSPGTNLVTATQLPNALRYDGTLCLSMSECLQPINSYHYQCTNFSIFFTQDGAVTARIMTGIIGFNAYWIRSECQTNATLPLRIELETLIDHSELPNLSDLRDPVEALSSIAGTTFSVNMALSTPAGTCTGINNDAATRCHQVWVFDSSNILTNYQGWVIFAFKHFIGGIDRTNVNDPFTLRLDINATCPSSVNVTDSSTAAMTLYRNQPTTIPYNGPLSPPFVVPSTPLVYAKVKANLGPSTANTQTLTITAAVLCVTTAAPFAPYDPLHPTGTGCATPGTNPIVFVIYDDLTNNITLPDIYNSILYRLPGEVSSEHNICFNATRVLDDNKCALLQVFYTATPNFNAPPPPPPPPARKPFQYSLKELRKPSRAHRRKWLEDVRERHGEFRMGPPGVSMTQEQFVATVLRPRIKKNVLITPHAPELVAAKEFCVRCQAGYRAEPALTQTDQGYCVLDINNIVDPSPIVDVEPDDDKGVSTLVWALPVGAFLTILFVAWLMCRRRWYSRKTTQRKIVPVPSEPDTLVLGAAPRYDPAETRFGTLGDVVGNDTIHHMIARRQAGEKVE